jgi:hypothetical protein
MSEDDFISRRSVRQVLLSSSVLGACATAWAYKKPERVVAQAQAKDVNRSRSQGTTNSVSSSLTTYAYEYPTGCITTYSLCSLGRLMSIRYG